MSSALKSKAAHVAQHWSLQLLLMLVLVVWWWWWWWCVTVMCHGTVPIIKKLPIAIYQVLEVAFSHPFQCERRRLLTNIDLAASNHGHRKKK